MSPDWSWRPLDSSQQQRLTFLILRLWDLFPVSRVSRQLDEQQVESVAYCYSVHFSMIKKV